MKVDLSQLKVEDKVKWRTDDFGSNIVKQIEYDASKRQPYKITYEDDMFDHYKQDGTSSVSSLDIIEIIPKEKPVSSLKRLVDLLAEGEEFIECKEAVYAVKSGVIRVYYAKSWTDAMCIEDELFLPAVPAKNPEKQKTVYQVLHRVENFYDTTIKRYASKEEFEQDWAGRNVEFVQLIEGSKQEIAE